MHDNSLYALHKPLDIHVLPFLFPIRLLSVIIVIVIVIVIVTVIIVLIVIVTYIYIYIHIYIHTYTYTHIYVCLSESGRPAGCFTNNKVAGFNISPSGA